MIHLLIPFLLAGDLPTQIEQIARGTPGKIGATVTVIETGESWAFHGGQHFPMQSVYKFPIAMAALAKVDAGALRLDQEITVGSKELVPKDLHSPLRDANPHGGDFPLRELLRYAVAESDGTTSDVLLRLCGGPEKAAAYLQGLGINGVSVATSEAEMASAWAVQYRNWATPNAMVKLLGEFYKGRGLSETSRGFLMQLMTQSTPGAKRIKGLLPQGTVVAHKTGTSGTDNGITAATNDVGIVTLPDGRHLAIAVFVSDSPAPEEQRESAIARIARAAWDFCCPKN